MPFFPTASLPEAVWVIAAGISLVLSVRAWRRPRDPSRTRLKNGIRCWANFAILGNGVLAMFAPPSPNPTWLSVLTPMTFAFAAFGMGLLSMIDEQELEAT